MKYFALTTLSILLCLTGCSSASKSYRSYGGYSSNSGHKASMTQSDYLNIAKAQHVIAFCGSKGFMSVEAQNIGTYLNENLRESKRYDPSVFAQLNQQFKNINIERSECKSYEQSFFSAKANHDKVREDVAMRQRMAVAQHQQHQQQIAAARRSIYLNEAPRPYADVQPTVFEPYQRHSRTVETTTECTRLPGVGGMRCTSRSSPEARGLDNFFEGMREGTRAYYGY